MLQKRKKKLYIYSNGQNFCAIPYKIHCENLDTEILISKVKMYSENYSNNCLIESINCILKKIVATINNFCLLLKDWYMLIAIVAKINQPSSVNFLLEYKI